MSDFLKQFSNNEYKKPDNKKDKQEEVKETAEIEEPKEVKIEKTKPEVKETKKVIEEPKKKSKNTFQTSNTKEETYVRDDEKIKKRRVRIIIASVVVVLLCIGGFFGYRQINKVTVPTFANEKTIQDVEVWAAKNKITLDSTSKYSVKVDEGMIISQSKKSGSSVQKGSDFKVVVSKGADPEELLNLPDFSKMKTTQIEDWKNENKASNITLDKVYSEEVENGTFMSMTFKTDGADSKHYRRKDKLTITVSKGKESFDKDIEVPNFKNKQKAEVETWANEKGVKVEFSEASDDKIMEGAVISQDIAPKTKIAKNDTLKISISRGKISYVPNFAGLNETQAQIEASKAGVMVTTVYYYSSKVPAATLISQSLPAGSEVSGDSVVLLYSMGKPYIPNSDGQDYYALIQTINEMNGKGANLSYEVQQVASSEPKGVIINTSAKADFVDIGGTVIIQVSRGY